MGNLFHGFPPEIDRLFLNGLMEEQRIHHQLLRAGVYPNSGGIITNSAHQFMFYNTMLLLQSSWKEGWEEQDDRRESRQVGK